MRIERVQYDGEGEWLDVVFNDGKKFRLRAELVRNLCEVAHEMEAPAPEEREKS